jgi:hypothetical protein
MEKMLGMQCVEHAKNVAGIVRETYGEVPGRVQETLFSGCGEKESPCSSRDRIGTFFYDFECTLGVPWEVIVDEKVCFCLRRLFSGTARKLAGVPGGRHRAWNGQGGGQQEGKEGHTTIPHAC